MTSWRSKFWRSSRSFSPLDNNILLKLACAGNGSNGKEVRSPGWGQGVGPNGKEVLQQGWGEGVGPNSKEVRLPGWGQNVGPRGPRNRYVRPGPPASAATPAMVRAVGEAAQGGQPGCWRPVACGGGRPRLGAVAWPAGTRLGPVGPGVGYMHPLSGVFSRLRTSLSSLRRDRAFNVLLRAR